MFMTPLILHFAFSPLQSAWRKLTDQRFEYQALDEQSKNNYHAIVSMCDDIARIHSPFYKDDNTETKQKETACQVKELQEQNRLLQDEIKRLKHRMADQ